MTLPRRALLLLALPAPGCALEALPAGDAARVRAGTHTLLLLRAQAIDQFGDHHPVTGDSDPLPLALGTFDTGGVPQPWLFRPLSPAAGAQGWLTTVLEPGRYYLAINSAQYNPGTGIGRAKTAMPRWRIAIPRGVAVVYAGTLNVGEVSGHGLFGRYRQGFDPGRTNVSDETEAAAAVLARDLPGLPPPRTLLMRPHEGPLLLGPPRA